MGENERLNAVQVALGNEMRERDFYLKNAERTRNQVGKTMFKTSHSIDKRLLIGQPHRRALG